VITLDMSSSDFEELLLALGFAAGAAHRDHDMRLFWRFIAITNRINRTNPNFDPYEIPAEFAHQTPTSAEGDGMARRPEHAKSSVSENKDSSPSTGKES
jgi:hypothetical protein